MKYLFLLLTISLLIVSTLSGQTPIFEVNATYQDGTTFSYTVSGDTYNFGVDVAGTNDLIVDDFEVIVNSVTETYQILRFADRNNIYRVNNSNISTEKQLVFFEEATTTSTVYNLRPSYLNTMEEVLLNEGINRGTDNVFANDGGANNNNIERIDFIFENGLVVPPSIEEEGFVILERGGNDDFKVAAITGLDSNGNPNSFGSIVDVDRLNDWGDSQFTIATRVLASATPSDDLVQTARTSPQPIDGVFISYGDLGFLGGESFFGYALAGGDASGTSTDWPDATNFPTNTDAGSDGAGGLDLMAGGSVSSNNLEEGSYTLTGDDCWRMLSSPVPTTYANLLNGLWTQGTTGADYTGGPPNVLIWPTGQSGNSAANWVTPGSLYDPVPAGTGVLVSVYNDDDFDGTVTTAEDFPKTVNIVGTGYSGNVTPTLNTNNDGWTLVGNPYNFPIDFSSTSLTKTDINDVAYIYDRNLTGTGSGVDTNGNTGGWRTTDGSYGDIVNGIIEPFQGFFIQNDGSSSVFTFSESAEDNSGNGQFYGKEKETPENVVRFEMNGEGLFNSAWVTVSGSGSFERTTSDALELIPFSDEYLLFGSRKGDSIFDIAHFPAEDRSEFILETKTTRPGTYTIEATDIDVHPELDLLFIDTKENVKIPVDQNFSYSFNINETVSNANKSIENVAGCGTVEQVRNQFIPTPAKANKNKTGRFILEVTGGDTSLNGGTTNLPSEFALNQNYPNPFNPTTQITYQLPRQADIRLEVFDMAGRQVATLVNQSVSAGTHTVNFDASELSSGVYMYRLQAGAMVLTRKLTLIK